VAQEFATAHLIVDVVFAERYYGHDGSSEIEQGFQLNS
jgi:hypothetical protein